MSEEPSLIHADSFLITMISQIICKITALRMLLTLKLIHSLYGNYSIYIFTTVFAG